MRPSYGMGLPKGARCDVKWSTRSFPNAFRQKALCGGDSRTGQGINVRDACRVLSVAFLAGTVTPVSSHRVAVCDGGAAPRACGSDSGEGVSR